LSLKERVYSVLVVSASDRINQALSEFYTSPLYSPVNFVSGVSAAERALAERDFDFVIVNSPLPDDSGIRFSIDTVASRNSVVLFLARAEQYADSFDRLAEALRAGDVLLAMGGEGVPVGQYTQKILAYYGLDEAALAAGSLLSYGEDVKAVATQISEKLVDCGVIYQTDAAAAKLTVVDTAAEAMCGRVIYPAAVLKRAKNPALAKDFLAFLQTPEAGELFSAVGFTPLTGN
jgi:molybdate transport system substrate-binding protein